MQTIEFYTRDQKFYEFSNFFIRSFQWQGKEWMTSEHAFQAAKFFQSDPDWADKIHKADSAKEAKRLGSSRDHPIDKEWDAKRISVMMEILAAKFSDKKLKELLLSTGDAKLVEFSRFDRFWGSGEDRKGQNHLGKCLMELRENFRKEK